MIEHHLKLHILNILISYFAAFQRASVIIRVSTKRKHSIFLVSLATILSWDLIMDFTTFVNGFDFFTDCFVYGSVAYVISLFTISLISAFIAQADEHQVLKQAAEPDFYQQVKELLNPCAEEILDLNPNPSFTQMTLRELRAYIRDNGLQQHIQLTLGKTVSNARKLELVKALS
jgi:hypothetical protein